MNVRCLMIFIYFLIILTENYADKPCLRRKIQSNSFVCVCNDSYCDTVTRGEPQNNTYFIYKSSEEGLRFHKSIGSLQPFNNKTCECCTVTLELNVDITYQTVEGFGGAVTDAAGINWKNLSVTLQKHLIDSYFSDKGLRYNMIRVPIGGSDFSTHPYAYNDQPENDTALTNYTLSYEDYNYKIPLIKSALATSVTPVHIIATTWSPPPWMKTNHKYAGISRLKPEYYQTYALYHRKFLEEYQKEGVPIWGLTTTNEPTSGALGLNSFNTLGWNVHDMGKWIVNNLGPTIRNSTHRNVKILAVDDQRLTIPYWFNVMVKENPKTLDYVDGVAVHYYTDMITPAILLSEIPKRYPKLFVISTEACEGKVVCTMNTGVDLVNAPMFLDYGNQVNVFNEYDATSSFPWQRHKVELGSWQRARSYTRDIITDLNHNVVGWIDWNICLNSQGGPNWAANNVDSPIIVFPERGEFVKQPMFYAIGHFSKFIPRGSQRIQVRQSKGLFRAGIENVAFATKSTVVIVLHNSGHATSVKVKLRNEEAIIMLEAKSITTIEFPYKKTK